MDMKKIDDYYIKYESSITEEMFNKITETLVKLGYTETGGDRGYKYFSNGSWPRLHARQEGFMICRTIDKIKVSAQDYLKMLEAELLKKDLPKLDRDVAYELTSDAEYKKFIEHCKSLGEGINSSRYYDGSWRVIYYECDNRWALNESYTIGSKIVKQYSRLFNTTTPPIKEEITVGSYVTLRKYCCGFKEGDVGEVMELDEDGDFKVLVPNRETDSCHSPCVIINKYNVILSTKEKYDEFKESTTPKEEVKMKLIFEVGKWYTNGWGVLMQITKIDFDQRSGSSRSDYMKLMWARGFASGDWEEESNRWTENPNNFKLATKDDIIKVFKPYILKKYPKGVSHKRLTYSGRWSDEMVASTGSMEYYDDDDAGCENIKFDVGIGYIYANGKWAEIVPEEVKEAPTALNDDSGIITSDDCYIAYSDPISKFIPGDKVLFIDNPIEGAFNDIIPDFDVDFGGECSIVHGLSIIDENYYKNYGALIIEEYKGTYLVEYLGNDGKNVRLAFKEEQLKLYNTKFQETAKIGILGEPFKEEPSLFEDELTVKSIKSVEY